MPKVIDFDGQEPRETPDHQEPPGVSPQGIVAIQGCEADIQQVEEVKQDSLRDAGEALKAGRLEDADRALKVAGEADQTVSHIRQEQLEQDVRPSSDEKPNIDEKAPKSPEPPEGYQHKPAIGEMGNAEKIESGPEKGEKERFFPREGKFGR
ncbi:MAG: hypothetical protein FJ010_05145 [Chloroflexi bacterium]|nr:hypothetical protein [Chloroflexota bacterium]